MIGRSKIYPFLNSHKVIKPKGYERLDFTKSIWQNIEGMWFLNSFFGDNNISDQAGNDHKITLNDTSFLDNDRSIYCDGVDGYMEVPSLLDTGAFFQDSAAWSLFIRVKVNSAPVSDETLASMWSVNSSQRAFRLDIDGGSQKWQHRLNSGTGVFSTNTVDVGRWYDLCVTCEYGVTGGAELYVDGVENGNYDAPSSLFSSTSGIPLAFGCRNRETVRNQFMDCNIEFIALWGRRVTAEEVAVMPQLLRDSVQRQRFYSLAGVAGGISGTGAFSIPIQEVSGTGEREITGDGAFTLPVQTLDGSGVVNTTITGTGDIQIAIQLVDGVGEREVTGTGDIDLPIQEIDGSGNVSGAISGTGDFNLPLQEVDGTGVREVTGTGAFDIPLQEIDGTGEREVTGTGSVELPIQEVDGSGSVSGVVSGTGEFEIPLQEVSGVGEREVTGDGDISLPIQEVDGSGEVSEAISGTGDFSIPLQEIDGTGEREVTGSCDVSIPIQEIDGVGSISGAISGTGDFSLPIQNLDGVGKRGVSGTSGIELPVTVVDGVGIRNTTITSIGDFSIPIQLVDGVGEIPGDIDGTGALTLPVPWMDGDDMTLIPIKTRLNNKIIELIPNMTIANGYSRDYGSVNEYDPDSRVYPAYFTESETETGLIDDSTVIDRYTVEAPFTYRVMINTSTDLFKELDLIISDFGRMLASYGSALKDLGMVGDAEYTEYDINYTKIQAYPAEIIHTWNIQYRRQKIEYFLT